MPRELTIRLGSAERGHVRVTVCEPVGTRDPHDYDWVPATIEVGSGAFSGAYDATLRADDFFRFRDALRPLYESLEGRATFETLEHQLRIVVDGDGKGHFHATCEARDDASFGNRLVFRSDGPARNPPRPRTSADRGDGRALDGRARLRLHDPLRLPAELQALSAMKRSDAFGVTSR